MAVFLSLSLADKNEDLQGIQHPNILVYVILVELICCMEESHF